MVSYDEWKRSINIAVCGSPNGDNRFIIGYGDWITEYTTYWGSLGESAERATKAAYEEFIALEEDVDNEST